MKSIFVLLVLFVSSFSFASIVAIMDTGTDISHTALSKKTWVNYLEKNDQNLDEDGDGLPGNVHGYDYTTNTAKPFDSKYNYLITPDVKTFFSLYAKFELGQIAPDEFETLRNLFKSEKLMNQANFVGGYIHGTHVAGISAINAPHVRIMSVKMLPTVYKEKEDPAPGVTNPPPPENQVPDMSIEELRAVFDEIATNKIEKMIEMHKVLHFHKVDVVNQSFGVSYESALSFVFNVFIETQKRKPTVEELNSLFTSFMGKLIDGGQAMYAVAPETMFCVAAGNDTTDNDVKYDWPSNVQSENKISVAATLGYVSLAPFSNMGEKTVDVAAPGVGIEATAPTDAYISLSGTSQATPFVTNTIAQMKDANPALKVKEIRAIVLETVDVKDWLRGKVVSSGIVNKDRAIKAALNLKTMGLNKAIELARQEVADVPVLSTQLFGLERMRNLDLGYSFNLKRPSLFVKE